MRLTQAQRYVLDELRTLHRQTEDEHKKEQSVILEEAFRQPLTVALNHTLNRLKRNKVTGDPLLQRLIELYHQYNLKEQLSKPRGEVERSVPKIICSEALI